MCKERLFGEAAKRRLDHAIHASRAVLASRGEIVEPYDQLLAAVRSRTPILSRRGASRDRPDVNRALVAMALHVADWLRPLESWRPKGGSAWPVLASLAEHLFASFPMPRFLGSVWLDGHGVAERLPQHEWYKQLGRGESVRRIDLPIRLTRAMAHRFLQAPDHFTVTHALRWAQVITLGGSDELVAALLATRLGERLENEADWEDVIRFFVEHPELPAEQVGPIVDFVQQQRFEVRDGVRPDGSFGPVPPPRPDFTLKGRTPAALLRLMAAWHEALGKHVEPEVTWPPAPLKPFQRVERISRPPRAHDPRGQAAPDEEVRVWTISELCSSRELVLDGRQMHHCVATYVRACRFRLSSIWSLQLETRNGRCRLLTIEVQLATRKIVQARRKYNGWPQAAELALMAEWAAREGLVVGEVLPR